jgi:hypothetical protein
MSENVNTTGSAPESKSELKPYVQILSFVAFYFIFILLMPSQLNGEYESASVASTGAKSASVASTDDKSASQKSSNGWSLGSFLSSGSNKNFKETQAGKALYSCVSTSGDLDVETTGNRVEAKLSRNNEEIFLQFEINPSINQAKLIGAKVSGKNEISILDLSIHLYFACGDKNVASQILPR